MPTLIQVFGSLEEPTEELTKRVLNYNNSNGFITQKISNEEIDLYRNIFNKLEKNVNIIISPCLNNIEKRKEYTSYIRNTTFIYVRSVMICSISPYKDLKNKEFNIPTYVYEPLQDIIYTTPCNNKEDFPLSKDIIEILDKNNLKTLKSYIENKELTNNEKHDIIVYMIFNKYKDYEISSIISTINQNIANEVQQHQYYEQSTSIANELRKYLNKEKQDEKD